MNDNIRIYDTLRLKRGLRKDNELIELSEKGCDFEYRRLLVEENEADLHVYFSRKLVCQWVSWGVLFLSISYLKFPRVAVLFYMAALVFSVVSFYWSQKFKKTFRIYNFCLAIVDSVILKDYGISLP